jgi:hypothetical protein
MAMGPSIFEFSTSVPCFVVALFSMQSHSGWRFSSKNISTCEETLFLTAIAVNIWYAFATVLSVACLLCM